MRAQPRSTVGARGTSESPFALGFAAAAFATASSATAAAVYLVELLRQGLDIETYLGIRRLSRNRNIPDVGEPGSLNILQSTYSSAHCLHLVYMGRRIQNPFQHGHEVEDPGLAGRDQLHDAIRRQGRHDHADLRPRGCGCVCVNRDSGRLRVSRCQFLHNRSG